MTLTPKQISTIGWIGTALALSMYISFIDVIWLNLEGRKGSWIMPLVTFFSAVTWASYGWFRKDWPIFVCNFPGIFLALTAFVTAIW